MGGGGYDVMMELALFVSAQWILGRAFSHFGAPDIVAMMITGIALGPEGANIVPYAEEDHDTHDPSILVLIGNMGVALMIFESGMHLHFDKVAEVGKEALGIAIVGTLAPIGLGVGIGSALGYDLFPDAVSMGVALAPTSVGISLHMLGASKMLNSLPGQTIITAAFIDDIFSLVMLVILINISAGEVTAESVVLPFVYSFSFVAFSVLLSIYVMPQLPAQVFKRFSHSAAARIQMSDQIHIGLMIVFVIFFGWIGALIGSHLLGTFAAGVAFANVPRSGLVWGRQVKRIVSWMVRLFFSASIGFSIPISVMFTAEAFWKGLVLGAVACIGGKILSGQASGDARWIVGWAMVARGEFAYLVAQTAKDAECKSCSKDDNGEYPMMLSSEGYAALVWALLWSTVLAPIFFKMTLVSYIEARGQIERAADIGGDDKAQAGKMFVMRLIGMHHAGILHEVMSVIHACGLDVLEAVAESDGLMDVDKFIVQPRSGDNDVDDDKLHEIAERVKEAINDDDSQVIFEPVDTSTDLEIAGFLEIRIIGDHHPDILHEVFDELALVGLDVVRAIVDEHTPMDTHGGADDKHTIPEEPPQTEPVDAQPGLARMVSMKISGLFDKPAHHNVDFKESEIIYARGRLDPSTGKRLPVEATKRAHLRKRIQELFESHNCHGEAMLKMVSEADAHESVHPVTAIGQDEEVCIITAHGKHHPDVIHEFLDEVAKLHLEVLHADISQPDNTVDEDRSLLYVRNIVSVDTLDMPPATERQRRHAVRTSLTEVYSKYNIDGHVSVRPLQGKRSSVISMNISASDLNTDPLFSGRRRSSTRSDTDDFIQRRRSSAGSSADPGTLEVEMSQV